MEINQIVRIGAKRCVICEYINEDNIKLIYLSDKKECIIDEAHLVNGKLEFKSNSIFTADRALGRYEHACSILLKNSL